MGGRGIFAVVAGTVLVVLTRLVKGSAVFGSTGLVSGGEVSASTGRGRGKRLAGTDATAGMTVTVPNIGAGCRPACMSSALAMIAMMATSASAPAIISFGLCRKMRIARLRSASASIAAALEPRRRGISSSLVGFLGTFLHLGDLLRHGGTRRRSQRCNIA